MSGHVPANGVPVVVFSDSTWFANWFYRPVEPEVVRVGVFGWPDAVTIVGIAICTAVVLVRAISEHYQSVCACPNCHGTACECDRCAAKEEM